MTRLVVHVPPNLPWESDHQRFVLEHLSYRLGGACAVSVTGRSLSISTPVSCDVERATATVITLAEEAATSPLLAEVIEEHLHSGASSGDPMPALIKSGDAVRLGEGRWAFAGNLLIVMGAVESLLATAAGAWGADERAYPTVLESRWLERAGYLRAFPHHVYFGSPVAATPGAVTRVAEQGWLDSGRPQDQLGPPDLALSPTVCYHAFASMAGTAMTGSVFLSAVNPCHRHETLPGTGLDRLHVFRMREMVQFGSPEEVAARLDHVLHWTVDLLKGWGLSVRVSWASDPFFATAPAGQVAFQRLMKLKREVSVRLDYGDRWLAVASFNEHRDSLTRAFEITGPSKPWVSGCVGFGIERLVLALIARRGIDLTMQMVSGAEPPPSPPPEDRAPV